MIKIFTVTLVLLRLGMACCNRDCSGDDGLSSIGFYPPNIAAFIAFCDFYRSFEYFVQLSCWFSVIKLSADRAIAALVRILMCSEGEESPGSIG